VRGIPGRSDHGARRRVGHASDPRARAHEQPGGAAPMSTCRADPARAWCSAGCWNGIRCCASSSSRAARAGSPTG
jgi:hypothetical protein